MLKALKRFLFQHKRVRRLNWDRSSLHFFGFSARSVANFFLKRFWIFSPFTSSSSSQRMRESSSSLTFKVFCFVLSLTGGTIFLCHSKLLCWVACSLLHDVRSCIGRGGCPLVRPHHASYSHHLLRLHGRLLAIWGRWPHLSWGRIKNHSDWRENDRMWSKDLNGRVVLRVRWVWKWCLLGPGLCTCVWRDGNGSQ